MLRELLLLFKSHDAIARMGEDFLEMIHLAETMTRDAGRYYLEHPPTPEERTSLYKLDVKVNKLERSIRKQVVAHLALTSSGGDAAYGLLLMSLVKDVERIGDYAKNVTGIFDDGGGPLPDDENTDELRAIRSAVEDVISSLGDIVEQSDAESAADLLRLGQDLSQRCDRLISRIAKGPYDAATTTSLVLGARYYKRINAHLMNVLTGVVMPLHKVDYYDERTLEGESQNDA